MSLIRAAGLAFTALAAVACGGTAVIPSGLPTIPPLPSGPPTVPPITIPSIEIPPLPSIPQLSFQPDLNLESLFPETIGGNPLEVTSATGSDVIPAFASNSPEDFMAVITGLGATIDQVSAGMSFNLWPGPTEGDFTGLTMIALQVRGVAAPQTMAALVGLVQEDVDNAQVGPQTIGGKNVTGITNPDDAEENVYLYAWNDVVFLVGGSPQAYVEEALSKLP
jgi:hypothetical protein